MDFISHVRTAQSPLIEMIWHARSECAGKFTSTAASCWEIVFSRIAGQTYVVARGPETRASEADFPADAEFFGITFKLGTFMPHLPVRDLRDRQDAVLPTASCNSFWLNGAAWEIPTFDNVDVFIKRLIHQGILIHDPAVEAAIQGQTPDLSARSLQYRFLQATGLTHKTIQQIERARSAVSLLEQGTSILDTAFTLGYCDQAHLTNSLRRFIGRTPAQIAQKSMVK
ncbi:MAG: helix-turn-helix domain-containing protein [Anaerolineae bacterium]